jgi:7,8-dihydro-6-hydroxymethylpterin-pyrophosphokinase
MDRDFVLVPMNEIDPDFIHPELNKKISDICTTVKIKTIISKLPVEASEK